MLVFKNAEYELHFDFETKYLTLVSVKDNSATVVTRFVMAKAPIYHMSLFKKHIQKGSKRHHISTIFKRFLRYYGMRCEIGVGKRFNGHPSLYDYFFYLSDEDRGKMELFIDPSGEYSYDNRSKSIL